MTRIGVLGGTFDPIHYGHLVIAEDARVYLHLDRVVFVPAYRPPHKATGSYSPFEDRVCMTELATSSNPHFVVSRIEKRQRGPSFTVNLIRALQAELGDDAELFFIIGMDSLTNILSWYRPDLLLSLCRLVVAERPGYHADMAKLEEGLPGLSARLVWIDTPELSISSTDLQRRIRSGLAIRYQLPPVVEEYICQHKLYQAGASGGLEPPSPQQGGS